MKGIEDVAKVGAPCASAVCFSQFSKLITFPYLWKVKD